MKIRPIAVTDLTPTPITAGVKKHAELAPSSAERWTTCHASVAACRGLPNVSNRFAREGTAAHELADMTLKSRHFLAENYIGARIEVEGEVFEVDDKMARFVQVYVDYVINLGGYLFNEARLPIDHVTLEPDAHGTTDAVVFSDDGTEMEVVDLKYGTGVQVAAPENLQLLIYAAAALRRYEHIFNPQWVTLTICQPRVRLKPSSWTITVAELDAYIEDIRSQARIVHGPGPHQFVPSRDACRFCLAKPTCQAYAEFHGIETFPGGNADIIPFANLDEE